MDQVAPTVPADVLMQRLDSRSDIQDAYYWRNCDFMYTAALTQYDHDWFSATSYKYVVAFTKYLDEPNSLQKLLAALGMPDITQHPRVPIDADKTLTSEEIQLTYQVITEYHLHVTPGMVWITDVASALLYREFGLSLSQNGGVLAIVPDVTLSDLIRLSALRKANAAQMTEKQRAVCDSRVKKWTVVLDDYV